MSDDPKRMRVIRAHLDPAIVARIDALVALLERSGRKATRAEILRKLVLAGLEEEEKGRAPPRSWKRTRV